MDSIYSSATLTIVSDSESADAGIPGIGIQRGPPQITFKHGGMSFIGARQTFDMAMSESCWESRAWCLQEKIFSKRLLIFTASQAFYHCAGSTYFEDTILESHGNGYGGVSMMERFNPRRKSMGQPRLTAYEAHQRLFGRNFWSLVESYTRRKLSFESDSIRAFSGILKNVETHSGPSVWGIPEYIFSRGLLWSLATHKMSLRRPQFPSWSWAGWRGNTGISLGFINLIKLRGDTIWDVHWHYYRLNNKGDYELVSVPPMQTDMWGMNIVGKYRKELPREAKESIGLSPKQQGTPPNPFARPAKTQIPDPDPLEDLPSKFVKPDEKGLQSVPEWDWDSAPSPSLYGSSSSQPAPPKHEAAPDIVSAPEPSAPNPNPGPTQHPPSPSSLTPMASVTLANPLPEPLSYFPPNTITTSLAAKEAAFENRDRYNRSWHIPGHPGEPSYTYSPTIPPMSHESTMPPITHIIRAYTSVARLFVDSKPDQRSFKNDPDYEDDNRYAFRVPETG